MVASFVTRRNGKVSEEDAQKVLRDVTYFGTMMVYMGLADGLVSGAVHSTGDTVRPALQIIKTKPGVSHYKWCVYYDQPATNLRNTYSQTAQSTSTLTHKN